MTLKRFLKFFLISYLAVFVLFILFFGIGRYYLQSQYQRSFDDYFDYPVNVFTKDITLQDMSFGVLFRITDPNLPTILVVHGGPGLPVPGVGSSALFPELNERFNVVFWDQRGIGASGEDDLVTIEELRQDIVGLSQHLKSHYDISSLILMAHDFGTIPAVLAAKSSPYLFDAYVGISQFVDFNASLTQQYEYLTHKANEIGMKKAIESLEELGPPPYYADRKFLVLSTWVSHFNAHFLDDDLTYSGFYRRFFMSPNYSLGDALSVLSGRGGYLSILSEAQRFKFNDDAFQLEVPSYYLFGDDYFTSAQSLLSQSGVKPNQVYVSPVQTHWPQLEDSELFKQLLSRLEK